MNLRLKKIPENSDRLVLNEVYEVREIDVTKYTRNDFILENKDLWYEVFSDGISLGLYDKKCFDNISKSRDNKLNKILNGK